jgi:glycosyltransferase involved in cell wall biosynthesis
MANVKAFKQAFNPNDNTVGLVLKTMNIKPNNPEWLAFVKECQTDKRIQLIAETLDRPEVLGLIKACDAYVSLHRAEGFGRTLAEAMLLGKPVIATNYSGNIDYMLGNESILVKTKLIDVDPSSYHWIDGDDSCKWGDVNISDVANSLKKILKKNNFRGVTDLSVFSTNVVSGKLKAALI